VECKQASKEEKYIRTTPWESNQDENELRLSDVGQFYIATQGNPNASAIIGELWVTYHVLLKHKRMYGGQMGSDVWTAVYNENGSSEDAPFTTSCVEAYDNMGASIDLSGAYGVFKFPDYIQIGRYIMIFHWEGTEHVPTVPVFTTQFATEANCTVSDITVSSQIVAYSESQDGAAGVYSFDVRCQVDITAAGASVRLPQNVGATTWPTTSPGCQLLVTQIPGNCDSTLPSAGIGGRRRRVPYEDYETISVRSGYTDVSSRRDGVVPQRRK
jgi:hypothetical protein